MKSRVYHIGELMPEVLERLSGRRSPEHLLTEPQTVRSATPPRVAEPTGWSAAPHPEEDAPETA